jgi:hypothetical protein
MYSVSFPVAGIFYIYRAKKVPDILFANTMLLKGSQQGQEIQILISETVVSIMRMDGTAGGTVGLPNKPPLPLLNQGGDLPTPKAPKLIRSLPILGGVGDSRSGKNLGRTSAASCISQIPA